MSSFSLDLRDPTQPVAVIDGVPVLAKDLTLVFNPETGFPRLTLVVEGVGTVEGVGEVERAATPREALLELLDGLDSAKLENAVASSNFSESFGESILRAVREAVARA